MESSLPLPEHDEGRDGGTESNDDSIDVAESMGFASFGSKPHLSRKRKMEELVGNEVDVKNTLSEDFDHSSQVHRRDNVQETSLASKEHSLPAKSPSSAAPGPGGPHTSQRRDKTAYQDSHLPLMPAYGNEAKNLVAARSKEQSDLKTWSGGVLDEEGVTAYFKMSFIEDPWKELNVKPISKGPKAF